MKILTWNTGLFSWFKYAHFCGLKLQGEKIEHEYFQKAHANSIKNSIKEINAHVVVLQEFYTQEDRNLMIESLREIYPYNVQIDTWYHEHAVMVLSRTPLTITKLGSSQFSAVKIEDLNIIPVHLNSFYPAKRLEQVQILQKELEALSWHKVCVLGDMNMWDIGGKKRFVFSNDKAAYYLLREHLTDCTEDVGSTTKVGLGLDKVFISHDFFLEGKTCIRKNAKYMDHYPVIVNIQ